VLKRDHEVVTVIVPADGSELPRAETGNARTSGPVRSLALETVAGSVAPPTRTADIEAMIEAAKDERAERLVTEMSQR
jgi:hypothetical protein